MRAPNGYQRFAYRLWISALDTNQEPVEVRFVQEPTTVAAGANFSPTITAEIVDQFGNRTTSTANVTLAIASGTGALVGTTTVAAVAGLVTFSNISVSLQGSFTLSVASSGLTGDTSASFAVTFDITSVAGLNFGFNVADTDTITTDLAGSTPVTADGQLVRYVGDLSVNGYNATQAVDARRATYKTAGGYHWLSFPGTNDINFDLSPLYDGPAGSDVWACFGVRFAGGLNFIIGATNDDGFQMMQQTSGRIRSFIGTSSGDIAGNGTTNTTNTDIVFTQEWNRAAGTLKAWQNEVLEVNVSGTPADKLNGAVAWLGAGNSATIAEFAGRMYRGFLFITPPSAADQLRIQKFVRDGMPFA